MPTGFRSDIRRGEIYWLDWSPGRGSEQAGRRPALVVGSDAANSNDRYPLTIVACISRTQRDILTHVAVEPDATNGLRTRSSIKCEQILTVEKGRLEEKIGYLPTSDMRRVGTALKRALTLN